MNIIIIIMTFNLILGCMYSGKSTELIRRYNRYTIANRKCLMIKYAGDTRYDSDNITTHDQIKVAGYNCKYLYDVHDFVNSYDVICIDEVQFYNDAYIMIDIWMHMGKIIEACGLNGTFRRQPFPVISKLIPLVSDITYLKAICKTNFKDAIYSKINDSINVIDSNQTEIIGGINEYDAVDRITYFDNKDFYSHDMIKDMAVIYAKANDICFDTMHENKIKSIDIKTCSNDNFINIVMNVFEYC